MRPRPLTMSVVGNRRRQTGIIHRVMTHTFSLRPPSFPSPPSSPYLVRHWQQAHLNRAHPQWEIPGSILNQDAEETFDGAEDSTVDHDGAFLGEGGKGGREGGRGEEGVDMSHVHHEGRF